VNVGPRPTVAVVGGGTMGTGIAYVCAAAGSRVVVVEPLDTQAVTMQRELETACQNGVNRGRLSAVEATELLGRIERRRAISEISGMLDIAIESVPERLALKQSVLAELEARGPKLLASNTSSIGIGELAVDLRDPTMFLGLHFFNPVWSLALVEVVRGTATSDETLHRALRFVDEIGKQAIVVADVPGFATSRLDFSSALEAMRMLEDGVASADDIDRAATLAYRHPVGPLRLSDIVGLDVRLDIARQLERTYGARFAPPQVLIDLVGAGHLGRKTGRGFHEWPENKP
jgi:3-hydroxybutyryl-CoA dehydrogenase